MVEFGNVSSIPMKPLHGVNSIPRENQAFGRIHRIGQEKETYIVKIVIEGTIDDRIMECRLLFP